jgi:hypothetical protein
MMQATNLGQFDDISIAGRCIGREDGASFASDK